MSNEVTSVSSPSTNQTTFADVSMDASPNGNGKGKGKAVDASMDEDEDDEEEEEDDDEELASDEEDEEEEEELFEEIDPHAILPRRTRGVKIDYSSKEALAKAGLDANQVNNDDDDEEEDVEMK